MATSESTKISPLAESDPPVVPGFLDALKFWLWLGFTSFGGPGAQIAQMHQELVLRRRWLSETSFVQALQLSALLPGPEAHQIATYSGWLMHRTRGALAAGICFVVPAAILMWLGSLLLVRNVAVPQFSAVASDLVPALVAFIVTATWRIGRTALKTPAMGGLAILGFLARILFPQVPQIVVLLMAALAGIFLRGNGGSDVENSNTGKASFQSTWILALVTALVWWLPAWIVHTFLPGAVPGDLATHFGWVSLHTFGGAYAILPEVAREAVDLRGWLTADQMIQGLAMAEALPGPLVLVLQHVGFVAGWNQPGRLSPLGMGTLGAWVASWATFVPSLGWILVLAPWKDAIFSRRILASALSGVMAAVVGFMAGLAFWMGKRVVTESDAGELASRVGIFLFCVFGMRRWSLPPIVWLVAAAVVGGIVRWLR